MDPACGVVAAHDASGFGFKNDLAWRDAKRHFDRNFRFDPDGACVSFFKHCNDEEEDP